MAISESGFFTGSITGVSKDIYIPIGTAASYSSISAIPAGAIVLEVWLNVTAVYDNAATIRVVVDGIADQEIMAITENEPSVTALYIAHEYIPITVAETGPVRVDITGVPTVGAANLIVRYVDAFLT